MKDKLLIVGSGPLTREKAPFDDESFDVLVFNEATLSPWVKRFDISFQMHKPESYSAPENFKCPTYWAWLQEKHGKPVLMQAYDERVPDCEVYPLEEVMEMIGGRKYSTGTVSYALAWGMWKGYKQIDIYGVEMSYTEYQYQAECWRFWLGFALGRGVKLGLHSGGWMLEAPLYGYEGNHAFPASHFEERAAVIEAEYAPADKHLRGAKIALDKAFAAGEAERAMHLIVEYQQAAMAAGDLLGKLDEARRYATYTPNKPADRGEFEYYAATHQRDGEKVRVDMHKISGQVEYIWNVWNQSKDKRALAQLQTIVAAYGGLAFETGKHHGAYTENTKYIAEYDGMYRAAGGQIGLTPQGGRRL